MLKKMALALAMTLGASLCLPAAAQKKYDTGVTDTEIKIGQTAPFSGPAAAYSTFAKAQQAYFNMINEQGGVNGRKIKLLTLDDGFTAPKAVEGTRQLVEQDEVFLIFATVGTGTNSAIQRYLNAKKIPQLFISTGAGKWNDPKTYPWTLALQLTYPTEAQIFADYVMKNVPNPKVAILWQNDDFGKDYVKAFKARLGSKSNMIVSEASYEFSDPTVDSQVIALKNSGANVFLNISTPRFAAQAIRRAADLGWKPTQFVPYVSTQVRAVMEPAGLDKSTGVISTAYIKDPSSKQWESDPEMLQYKSFMKKYYPEGDADDWLNAQGLMHANALVTVLKQAGDNLTRENVMKIATNMKNVHPMMVIPGITVNTSPTDYSPIKSAQMIRFDGARWVPVGGIVSVEGPGKTQ